MRARGGAERAAARWPRSTGWPRARRRASCVCLWEREPRAPRRASCRAGPVAARHPRGRPRGRARRGRGRCASAARAASWPGSAPASCGRETAGPVALALLQARYGDLGRRWASARRDEHPTRVRGRSPSPRPRSRRSRRRSSACIVGARRASRSARCARSAPTARTVETLLARWLDECLYVHEVEGFVARRVEWVVLSAAPRPGGEPIRLHACSTGKPVTAAAAARSRAGARRPRSRRASRHLPRCRGLRDQHRPRLSVWTFGHASAAPLSHFRNITRPAPGRSLG